MKKFKLLILICISVFTLSCSNDNESNTNNDSDNLNRFFGNVILTTQNEVENFGVQNFKEITGFLLIGSFDENGEYLNVPESSNINNLSSLSSLERVRGDFIIRRNSNLVSLEGLNNLKTINGFDFIVSRNENLADINALSNLEFVEKNLYFFINSSLTDFCALTDLFDNSSTEELFFLTSNNGYNPSFESILEGNRTL